MRINASDYTVIPLGVQTDGNVTEVAFDLTPLIEQAGDGEAVVFHKRPVDADAYPCVAVREGDLLIWQISSSDTAIAGNGLVKVVLTNGDKVANTNLMQTLVAKTMAEGEDVPEPYEAWVNQVIQAATDATDAKEELESSTFELDPLTGILYWVREVKDNE